MGQQLLVPTGPSHGPDKLDLSKVSQHSCYHHPCCCQHNVKQTQPVGTLAFGGLSAVTVASKASPKLVAHL